MRRLFVFVVSFFFSIPVSADISLYDSEKNLVELDQPATRIVSLAPHVTELLFAAGAGNRIVAAVEFSDYPEAARNIPRIGDAWRVDREALLALRPDLVIAWASGTPAREREALRNMGMRMYLSEPRKLEDIGAQLRDFGRLAGTTTEADSAAARYEQELAALREAYAGRERVRVFNQIGIAPLMTVNGDHLMSAVLALCGADNVFAELPELAPVVSVEAVIAAEPQVVLYAIATEQDETAIKEYWSTLAGGRFAKQMHYIGVPVDYIHRPTPRILKGARQICEALEEVRGEM